MILEVKIKLKVKYGLLSCHEISIPATVKGAQVQSGLVLVFNFDPYARLPTETCSITAWFQFNSNAFIL